jgi:SAM-dependent methyltransferase
MQARHSDRERYFNEQVCTTSRYYIPYIRKFTGAISGEIIEVGCGEGGNLFPFAQMGCKVTGVDIDTTRIQQARAFFSEKGQQGAFLATDIFQKAELQHRFSLIVVHDVIEHIEHKAHFLSGLKNLLSPGGIIFIAFPAWQMPFGGHQQTARGKIISHLPFIHLLPPTLYRAGMKICGENENTVQELLTIKKTKCSIELFQRIVRQTGYRIINRQLWFINPHYEVKFGFTPCKLHKVISAIPYLRNFLSTSCFYIIKPKE